MKTIPQVDRYTFRVTWSDEDQQHVGLCAEFPSLSWLAKSPEAALRGIRTVVRDVVADMATSGEEIPSLSPRTLTAVAFWFVFRPICTAPLPCRPPRPASA